MKQAIYETKGRAREFNPLAINLFTGCGHKCIYCYGAVVTHQDKDVFENHPRPRLTLEDIDESARSWAEYEYRAKGVKPRRILLCFVTDPYQPIEAETQFTRHTIEILHKHQLNVIILTKGGLRSTRDFDLLTPQDAYATTLTFTEDSTSLKWEPGAASPKERIQALQQAHARGIETWVSFEPVIDPDETRSLLHLTKEVVGHYKVGTMNYHPRGKQTDWGRFGWGMKREMDRMGVPYYFKNDLLKEMAVPQGQFRQTWICG